MMPPSDLKDRFLVVIFVVSIVWSAWGLTRGWDLQLSGCHGFRQTQTALTSYYMLHGEGSFLNYETPVLGAPWSIPFEFPLYQWVTAKSSSLLSMPSNEAGRLVSVTFFALAILALWGAFGTQDSKNKSSCVYLSVPCQPALPPLVQNIHD
jgi:hypothetical protein